MSRIHIGIQEDDSDVSALPQLVLRKGLLDALQLAVQEKS